MGTWNHIILEAYCCYSWASKKKHVLYGMDKQKPEIKMNKDYIPPSKRSSWCKKNNPKMVPKFECLYPKECPFLAYCDTDEKHKKVMLRAWWDMVDREEEGDTCEKC
jgi:hypothetical protein